jgi:tetratricopeptide (TPR) repeat protein
MHKKQDLAIQAALEANWELAVELNLGILDEDEHNIAALNRLARAYTELGQKDAAKTVYQKVLSLDKYNAVALKNLKVLPHQKITSGDIVRSREDFIEEPGKTKAVNLIKVADRALLLSLECKQTLSLVPRARLIAVTTADRLTIGYLPDDLSLKLKKLLAHGYEYAVCLKSASDNTATIFVREIKRPRSKNATASFLKNGLTH